jgi:hypothetical protein
MRGDGTRVGEFLVVAAGVVAGHGCERVFDAVYELGYEYVLPRVRWQVKVWVMWYMSSFVYDWDGAVGVDIAMTSRDDQSVTRSCRSKLVLR